MPRDYDRFFRKAGLDYVESSIRDGSFTGETLARAEVWRAHYLEQRKRLIERLLFAAATAGPAATLITPFVDR